MTYTCDIHIDNIYGKPETAWRVVLSIYSSDPTVGAIDDEYEITEARLYAKPEPLSTDLPFEVDLVDLLSDDTLHDLRREAIVAWEDDGECDQAGYPEGMDGGRDDRNWHFEDGRDGLD